jgi:glycosyltransferase involved in cell wall biosynthesis
MRKIREITIFANNDINNINTWSGVPCFFANALKVKDIKINYVCIGIEPKIEWIYGKIIGTIIVKLLHNQRADYSTSLLRYLIIRQKIKRGISKYPHSDCFVFFTFCYSAAGLTKIPSIMISDWTLDYYMKFILKRKPRFFEQRVLRRDDREIEATQIIFSLFPGIVKYMRSKYNNKNIYYFGNAVNCLRKPPDGFEDRFADKHKARKILFIGGKKYLTGLEDLIKAFQILKNKFTDLSIHIIGFSESDIASSFRIDGLYFYGYLDKGANSDSEIYYDLLSQSTVFVNTTVGWSSFQSPVEALFFYTPVIISYNKEFVETFGEKIKNCCFFCKDNDQTALVENIKFILNNSDYEYMAKASHECVKNFTWDVVADNFLAITSELIS